MLNAFLFDSSNVLKVKRTITAENVRFELIFPYGNRYTKRLYFPSLFSCIGSYRSRGSIFLTQILVGSLRIYFCTRKLHRSAKDLYLTPIRSCKGNETYVIFRKNVSPPRVYVFLFLFFLNNTFLKFWLGTNSMYPHRYFFFNCRQTFCKSLWPTL